MNVRWYKDFRVLNLSCGQLSKSYLEQEQNINVLTKNMNCCSPCVNTDSKLGGIRDCFFLVFLLNLEMTWS
jgi:hypothetical protein